VDDDRYHDGRTVSSLRRTSDAVTVTFEDGSLVEADLVIGADGHRSVVRGPGHGAFEARFAGYVAWRLGIPEDAIVDPTPLRSVAPGTWFTICYPGGHAIIYWIPGREGTPAGASKGRVLNFVIYGPAPDGLATDHPTGIPPGEVDPAMRAQFEAFVATWFPPWWSASIRRVAPGQLSLQPVYDGTTSSYVDGPIVLVGDAASLARPHTGSGATKALSDALALGRACRGHDTWSAALDEYDAERRVAGNELVALSRRMGHDMVEATPEWSAMDGASLDAFTQATVAGRGLYFYGNASDP
jgi:2-polyprenyl-6-methoxyphenol hydroxylase-like FAD-dependent oxidoreductase